MCRQFPHVTNLRPRISPRRASTFGHRQVIRALTDVVMATRQMAIGRSDASALNCRLGHDQGQPSRAVSSSNASSTVHSVRRALPDRRTFIDLSWNGEDLSISPVTGRRCGRQFPIRRRIGDETAIGVDEDRET
jgi:hypothetical protein